MPLVLPPSDARWTWDFGDGSPRVATREPSHTYYRPGTFLVRAFAGTRELARTRVEVAPRPVESLLPAGTRFAAWLDPSEGAFEAVVDTLEQLRGPAAAGALLERWVLPALVLRWRAEAPAGAGPLDPEDPVGVLVLPGYSGVIAFAGVADATHALAAVFAELTARGGVPASHPSGGSQFTMPDGAVVGVLLDRGHLFVCVPALPDGGGDPALVAIARGPEHDPARVFDALRAVPDRGAVALAPFGSPWPAAVRLFASSGGLAARGAARVTSDAIDVEGLAAAPAPPGEAVGDPPLLAHVGPATPAVIGAVGLSPGWLLSRAGGTAPRGWTALLAALAPSALWTAEPTSDGGRFRLEGAARDPAAVRAGAARVGWASGAALRVTGEGTRVEVEAGPPWKDRSPAPLVQTLQARHGDGAFGRGHLSLEVDGAALRSAAAAGRTLRLPLLEDVPWTQVDRLFVDVAAGRDGLQLRARLELRGESSLELALPGPDTPGRGTPAHHPVLRRRP